MIAKIEGIVWDVNNKYITVGVGGIGFKVYVTEGTKTVAHKGKDISLFTHLAVREDALDLYGFADQEELNFFELSISISGIGPKTALNILNVSSVPVLKRAIASGDTTHLVKISGIGKKIAEKIVLELKDKIGAGDDDHGGFGGQVDALEALKSLGYSHREARDALKDIEKKFTKTEDIIKEALKILGK
ncbi:MAG: Holliday junction branch migration protein RuvA [Candidatus Paceibacterota bacterium]|jgi:Holliday junction DNA helicase RuvA